jgi:hypothetical protein
MMEYNKSLWKESFMALAVGIPYELHLLRAWSRGYSAWSKERIRAILVCCFAAGIAVPLVILE